MISRKGCVLIHESERDGWLLTLSLNTEMLSMAPRETVTCGLRLNEHY